MVNELFTIESNKILSYFKIYTHTHTEVEHVKILYKERETFIF